MRRIAGLVAGVSLLALAGCGGDGGGERLSKDELISKADAICTKYNSQRGEIDYPNADPTAEGTSDDDVRAFEGPLNETADLAEGQVGELRELKPPEDVEDRYGTAMDDLDTVAEAAREAADAAGDADRAGVKAAYEKAGRAGDEADAIAREIGMKVCGSS
jgi:hypothetical protein